MPESGDLRTQVKSWLEHQGYPLEMEVASVFLNAGFATSQSVFYADPQEGTPREIDVVATQIRAFKQSTLSVTFMVECKRSVDRPWVALSTHALQPDARRTLMWRVASEYGAEFLVRASRRSDVRELALLAGARRPAYGLTEALKERKDSADASYTAVMSVAKAAHSRAAEMRRLLHGDDASSAIVFPVVVVDGPLFEFRLQPSGERELDPVDRATLFWRHPGVGGPLTVIDIVTRSGLSAFVEDASAAVACLLSCHEEVAEVEDLWAKRQVQQTRRRVHPDPT